MHKDREAHEDRLKFREVVIRGAVFSACLAGTGLFGYVFFPELRHLFAALMVAGLVVAGVALTIAAGTAKHAAQLEDDPDTSGLAVLYERQKGRKPSRPASL